MPTPRSLTKIVLREAYKAIRAGYTTWALARTESGECCFVNDHRAVVWSLTGALQLGEIRCAEAHGGGRSWHAYSEPVGLIQREMPSEYRANILKWGDSLTQQQALAVIQRAGSEV